MAALDKFKQHMKETHEEHGIHKEPPTHFAFYGTLRSGQYNYTRFNLDELSKRITQVWLSGYKMHCLGSYPMVVKTGDEADKILVDCVVIEDKTTRYQIHYMELGAGYGVEIVNVDGVDYTLYTYPEEGNYTSPYAPKIKNGDWVKFTERGFYE